MTDPTDTHREVPGLRFPHGSSGPEQVVVEGPLAVALAGVVFTVTMRTPGQDRDLARGLLFSEGIIADRGAHPISLRTGPDGDVADCRHPDPDLTAMGRRTLAATSSCGLCGTSSLAVIAARRYPVLPPRRFDAGLLAGLMAIMDRHQPTFAVTGGCHAAAAFTQDGTLLGVREDIGRHNAVDKVIGALLGDARLDLVTALTVSGRISYEIVAKCLTAGIGCLLAVSAPSSLAIDLAVRHGMLLAGFCRNGRLTVYAGAHLLEPVHA